MIIHIQRSGGFTGMSPHTVIDTDQLGPQERQELQGLVELSGFFSADVKPIPDKGQADRFNYRISIEDGTRQRTVELDESEIPEAWQPLIQRINMLARRFRGRS